MKKLAPKITVALPTLNRDIELVNTVKDILKQKFDSFELIIVDQSESHDKATTAYLAKLKDERVSYYQTTPASLPAARNYALERAKADIILFLDDDIELHDPNFINWHYKAFQKDKDIVAVAGKVVNKDNRLFVQVESKTTFYFDKYGIGHESFNCPVSQYATEFPGGNMALKTDVVKKLGGFDVNYRGSAVREESDLAHRFKQSGGKIYYEAKAEILHLAAPAGGTRIQTHYFDNQMFYVNDSLFAIKTVKLRYLPVSFAKRYVQCIRGQGLGGIIRRSGLFIIGILRAMLLRVYPYRLIQTEVKST